VALQANQAVMETMTNRAVNRGPKPSLLSALERSNSEENLRKVLAGSNITDYATDNSSGDLARREARVGEAQS
jgi:hypothetical protein